MKPFLAMLILIFLMVMLITSLFDIKLERSKDRAGTEVTGQIFEGYSNGKYGVRSR